MGSFSVWHWVVVGILVLLLFGRGRISEMMGDVAKGIKSFRKGLQDDETDIAAAKPAPRVTADPAPTPARDAETQRQA
jgi:sec-independent protein translocase protein TatA